MNNVKIRATYVTNFSINTAITSNFDFKLKNKNKIFCKNFIVFFMLFKHFSKKNNVSYFVKPFYRNILTLLRAPYRHKLSRHQFKLQRYHILLNTDISTSLIFFKNINEVKSLISIFRKYYHFFETNIIFQKQLRLSFFFRLNNFFIIKNYKK